MIILLFGLSVLGNAQAYSRETESVELTQEQVSHYYQFEEDFIIIFYDQYDKLSNNTAMSILDSIGLMTPNIVAQPVNKLRDINTLLDTGMYKIAIYVFPTDDQSLMTHQIYKERKYSWDEVSSNIKKYSDIYHIFGTGNTAQLFESLGDYDSTRIFGSGDEVIDAQQLYIYTLWTLADILEKDMEGRYGLLGNDVRMATLQYFADNFNQIAATSVSASNPMGVEAPETKEARVNKFMNDHPVEMNRAKRPGMIFDEEKQRYVDAETGEVATNYGVDIFPSEASLASDFILQFIPEETGLRGPIGGILDGLLGELLKFAGDQIGLDMSVVQKIVEGIQAIPALVGAISDPSGSKIKELIDQVRPMLPISEEFDPYIDLLIDALFLLRGDSNDITSFISSAIGLLVPESVAIDGTPLKDILGSAFSIGTDIFNKIQDGGSVIDIILSVLNENMLTSIIETLMADNTVFGLSASEVTDAISYISSMVGMITNLITNFDLKELITNYGPALLSDLLGSKLGLDDDKVEIIMTAVSGVLAATGLIDDVTIEDVMFDLFEKITGMETTALRSNVDAVMLLVSNAVNSGLNSVSDFKNSLTDALAIPGIQGTQFETAIKDLLTLIVAVSSTDFTSPAGLGDLGTVIVDLLAQWNIVSSSTQDTVKNIINTLLAVVNFIKNPPNLKTILGSFMNQIPDLSTLLTEGFKLLVNLVKPGTFPLLYAAPSLALAEGETSPILLNGVAEDAMKYGGQAISLLYQLITKSNDNALENLMMTLLQGGTFILSKVLEVDLNPYVELLKAVFGQVLGISDSPPSLEEVLNLIIPLVPVAYQDVARQIIPFVLAIRDVFTGGFRTLFSKLSEMLAGLITDLVNKLTGDLLKILEDQKFDLLDIKIPLAIGPFSLFTIRLYLSVGLNLEFNVDKLLSIIFDVVFSGATFFKDMSAGDILREALSFVNIAPVLEAGFALEDFGSGEQSLITYLLEAFGLQLEISGEGWFKLLLFSFQNGVFSTDNFFKVIEWGFKFTITISRTFTLLDFITGGVGGGLNAIGKYIGLDAISITISFTLAIEVIKRAATANAPETGTMTISFTIGFTVSLGIDILIAELKLTGTLEITLTLLQDLISPGPLRVFVAIQLTITVTIGFLFWDWDFDFKWSPSGYAPPLGKELTAGSPQEAADEGAIGLDSDEDGLGDEYEKSTPGLKWDDPDSDGDGLDDKFETQTLKTDPANPDSDGDGLDDKTEYDMKTDPLNPDSDFDQLTDYEEAAIYGTDPFVADTDEDGLTDYYEVNHVYNMTGITPTVSQIMIGGVPYDDRTDPLNPDTDGDGLLDGQEGTSGIYYGPELYNLSKNNDDPDAEQINYTPDPALIFNGGYTHPLDADTDDDSYWQTYDGKIAPMADPFLMDMSDYVEVYGQWVTYIDTETGEPLPPELVRTNPTNPDSDGDTGVTPEQRENPPFGFFLNSDGYELSRTPPTDPLNGDTDGDGLIDGLEGMLRPDSNHTWGLNPDTDGDGLGDLQEFELGTDPRSVDTDRDGVSDGDEYFKYGTNPFLPDTDLDGLEDGEELFIYHSNPFSRDTDGDGLLDYDEVWKYFSKPADEDSDNDFLTDYEEIMIYYTDPFNEDTDGDLILDGDEVMGLPYEFNGSTYLIFTDPLKWDTDGDSLLTLDQNGEISQSMSDYDEWLLGTDPTRSDTDLDGIADGWEMWLGKGLIPTLEAMDLDPLSSDTDGDGMLDGQELVIANISTALNPYIAFYVIQPYNTSPVKVDTDGDFLNDTLELLIGSDPTIPDTDNDTLTDFEEWAVYGTLVYKNDTDGDGLLDQWEINGFTPYNVTNGTMSDNTLMKTDPLDSDTDGDLLPDGAELMFYSLSPLDDDVDNSGIIDGMEIDTDGDGLMDGEEYYVYRTVEAGTTDNAIQDPDSDKDGLFDGLEVYETDTDPALFDTDNDTYSDGLEIYCGTNPRGNTSAAEIGACFEGLARLAVISPLPYNVYKTNAIPTLVYDSTGNATVMEYRYKSTNENASWSLTQSMSELPSKPGYWSGPNLILPPTNDSYVMEITAVIDGETKTRTIYFEVDARVGQLEIETPKDRITYNFGEFDDPKLPVRVIGSLDISNMWFRIYTENGSLFMDNTTIPFDTQFNVFLYQDVSFPKIRGVTEYTIEVYAQSTSGDIFAVGSTFAIGYPTLVQNLVTVGAPVAVGTGAVVAITYGVKNGFKNPFKKEEY